MITGDVELTSFLWFGQWSTETFFSQVWRLHSCRDCRESYCWERMHVSSVHRKTGCCFWKYQAPEVAKLISVWITDTETRTLCRCFLPCEKTSALGWSALITLRVEVKQRLIASLWRWYSTNFATISGSLWPGPSTRRPWISVLLGHSKVVW